ncbi:hypothetical protein Daus18300_009127 [Diaporthe australafricana]|uniref:Uncharacterized protein n=1 Tax=Diaporthe australafricana TaxID=127596 RepID=A0ABR3WFC0_9PEZI
MLLRIPKDKAINSIRRAMAGLILANRGLLAQELINKLESHVGDTSGSSLYPSWCKNDDPSQLMSWGVSEQHALRRTIHRLRDAFFDFEAAGMSRAANVCREFAMIVFREFATA